MEENKKEVNLFSQVPALSSKMNLDEFNEVVGIKPEKYKPKKNNGVEYFEIGFIEGTLDRIFNGLWNTKIIDTKIMANSVVVSIELWYYNPALKIWQFKSGIGAAPINTKKGASPTDFNNIINDSVQKAAPSAKSYAVKNAAQQIGNAFGRYLNREFQHDFKKDDKFDKLFEDDK